jgi:hypothetical protein
MDCSGNLEARKLVSDAVTTVSPSNNQIPQLSKLDINGRHGMLEIHI